MSELGSYSGTQGPSTHWDPIRVYPHYGGTLEGSEYFQGSSGNQDLISGTRQGFELFPSIQSYDYEQAIAQLGPTHPLLLPFPTSEPIAPQFNPPPVPPPPGETSTNSYVNDRIATAHALTNVREHP